MHRIILQIRRVSALISSDTRVTSSASIWSIATVPGVFCLAGTSSWSSTSIDLSMEMISITISCSPVATLHFRNLRLLIHPAWYKFWSRYSWEIHQLFSITLPESLLGTGTWWAMNLQLSQRKQTKAQGKKQPGRALGVGDLELDWKVRWKLYLRAYR